MNTTAASAREPIADAIVVLGTAVEADGRPSPALQRRLDHAIALWLAGRGHRLLLSGGPAGYGQTEAGVMQAWVRAAGVPASAIVLEAHARTTLDNAVNCTAIARTQRWQTLLLVSERYHLPRARLAFRLAGAPVIASSGPAEPPGGGWAHWLRLGAHEAGGYLWYLLRAPVLRRRR